MTRCPLSILHLASPRAQREHAHKHYPLQPAPLPRPYLHQSLTPTCRRTARTTSCTTTMTLSTTTTTWTKVCLVRNPRYKTRPRVLHATSGSTSTFRAVFLVVHFVQLLLLTCLTGPDADMLQTWTRSLNLTSSMPSVPRSRVSVLESRRSSKLTLVQRLPRRSPTMSHTRCALPRRS